MERWAGSIPHIVRGNRPVPPSVHDPQADSGAGEPEDGAQEAEGLARSPAVAEAAVGNPVPVEDTAAAAMVAEGVDEEAERGKPGEREHQVDGPVDEATGEGDEPDQGENNGEAGYDFGVDKACLGPGVGVVEAV